MPEINGLPTGGPKPPFIPPKPILIDKDNPGATGGYKPPTPTVVPTGPPPGTGGVKPPKPTYPIDGGVMLAPPGTLPFIPKPRQPPVSKRVGQVMEFLGSIDQPQEQSAAAKAIESKLKEKIKGFAPEFVTEAVAGSVGVGVGALAGGTLKSKVGTMIIKSPIGIVFSSLIQPDPLNTTERQRELDALQRLDNGFGTPGDPQVNTTPQWQADP